MNANDLPLTLKVPEAAKLLGVGQTSMWEAVRQGQIRSVRLGRRVLIPRSALLEFVGEGEKAA